MSAPVELRGTDTEGNYVGIGVRRQCRLQLDVGGVAEEGRVPLDFVRNLVDTADIELCEAQLAERSEQRRFGCTNLPGNGTEDQGQHDGSCQPTAHGVTPRGGHRG